MRSMFIGSALAISVGVTLSSQEWQPPRTPDGQPDISGIIWTTGPDDTRYTGDLETGVADPVGRKIQGRGSARAAA